MKLLSLISICSALALSSCQWLPKGTKPLTENPNIKTGHFINKVDTSAKKISAKYGKDYNLTGNTVAVYPGFTVTLVSTTIKKNSTTCTYKVVSKNGLEKENIVCSTANPEKQHLYLEDMHFFYHSNEPGKLNIYIPAILIASIY